MGQRRGSTPSPMLAARPSSPSRGEDRNPVANGFDEFARRTRVALFEPRRGAC
jgi:hypothetical protein